MGMKYVLKLISYEWKKESVEHLLSYVCMWFNNLDDLSSWIYV